MSEWGEQPLQSHNLPVDHRPTAADIVNIMMQQMQAHGSFTAMIHDGIADYCEVVSELESRQGTGGANFRTILEQPTDHHPPDWPEGSTVQAYPISIYLTS